MSWRLGAWTHPTDTQWPTWDTQRYQVSFGDYRPWQTPGVADCRADAWKPPVVKSGGFASTRYPSRKPGATKAYESYTTLGGNAGHALPVSERVKLIVFMIPDARELRVTALGSDELDAVIYLATGQQPSLRPELNRGTQIAELHTVLCCMCVEQMS